MDRCSSRRSRRGSVARLVTLVSLLVLPAAVMTAQEPESAPTPLALCIGCHAPGEAPAAPTFPSLSGQQAEYLAKQLRDYKSGRRVSAIMSPPLATVNRRDIVALAAFFSGQPPMSAHAPADAALVERGRNIYRDGIPASGVANCAGCHGADGAGSGLFPRLAGLAAAYIEQQLSDFKSATRTNDRARVMRVVSSRLTDDDIKAVAEYIAGLGQQ